MRTLYIAVDESGLPTKGKCFTVAAAWYVAESTEPANVLMRTKDKVLEQVKGHARGKSLPGEIKAGKLHPQVLNDLVPYVKNIVYEDSSLVQSRLPWTMNIPLGFTITTVTPQYAAGVLSKYSKKRQRAKIVKSTCLNAVLAPLFMLGVIDISRCDRVEVLLDSTTWKNAMEDYESTVAHDDIAVPGPSFVIVDSKAVPGIQFGDLATSTWRRNLLKGDCQGAVSTLHNLRFAR